MSQLMGILSFLVNIYMIIIFVRIIMTWFTGISTGGLQDILGKITDPYLNWFRRYMPLRVGFLDLSPIVALGILSIVNGIFNTLAHYGRITIGIILAMILQAVWSALSFFIGFLIIVLVLRLIGYLAKQGAYNPFWRIVDTISRPVLLRINNIFARGRIPNFTASVILSIVSLGIVYIILVMLVSFVSGILVRLPF